MDKIVQEKNSGISGLSFFLLTNKVSELILVIRYPLNAVLFLE